MLEFLILLIDIDGLLEMVTEENKNAKLISMISEKDFDSNIFI